MTKNMKIMDWILSLVAAVILLQTLFFKFSAAEESVYIFTQVGMEPWGRIGIGVVELIAATLILIPNTRFYGAGLSAGTIAGALFMHLTLLGIDVQGDGGLLFGMAVAVFLANLGSLWINKATGLDLLRRLLGR